MNEEKRGSEGSRKRNIVQNWKHPTITCSEEEKER
jgi:hypothetical protein